MNLKDLKQKSPTELLSIAEDLGIDWYTWSSVSGLKVWDENGFKVINPDCITIPQILDYYIKNENDKLKEYEHIIIAGEALSHCVANTIRDLSVYIPAYRMIVLTDCTSNVAGFEHVGNDFINEFRAKGVQFVDSKTLILD